MGCGPDWTEPGRWGPLALFEGLSWEAVPGDNCRKKNNRSKKPAGAGRSGRDRDWAAGAGCDVLPPARRGRQQAVPWLAHPPPLVKGGWDARNAARPEADAQRCQARILKKAEQCVWHLSRAGEEERGGAARWERGCHCAPASLRFPDRRAGRARIHSPAPLAALAEPPACARLGLSTKHVSPSSAGSSAARRRRRRTHPALLCSGGGRLLFSPRLRNPLSGWRATECSCEDALGADSEPGAEDMGAHRPPALVAQM